MKRIAFIGLGNMGEPMAANLLRAGFAVTVYNRHPEKADALVQLGATTANSPAEAARGAEAVLLMISDNAAVRAVVLGPQGVAEGAAADMILINMSTVAPEVNRELARALAPKGVLVLDAPVTGSVKPATEGSLTIMVGGEQSVYTRCLPIFQAMGKQILYVGPLGSGNHLKLCNNLLLGAITEAVSEALVLAEKGGINRKTFLDVIAAGASALNSPWFQTKLPYLLSDDCPVTFALKHITKDLGYAMEEAHQLTVSAPCAAATFENFKAAMNHGLAEEDMTAIIHLLEPSA